jgi:hypothetical protein
MANQYYWSASWVSAENEDMAPGEVHLWWANPFQFGDSISLTAHPVAGDPTAPHRVLAVEEVRIDRVPDADGGTLLFSVRNVGNTLIPAYIIGSNVVNQ